MADETFEEGALESVRKRLYDPQATAIPLATPVTSPAEREVTHTWEESPIERALKDRAEGNVTAAQRRVRVARQFFMGALTFFGLSVVVALLIIYFGGNTVSVDKIQVQVEGPTTLSGGDAAPLTITITNTNAVAIQDVAVTVDFPQSARSADDPSKPYPRYTEELGTLESGISVTRSVKAILFGSGEEAINLPISVSYTAPGSNAVFVKRTTYALTISNSPLSISVESSRQAVSGKPLSFKVTVRSNAQVPLDHVVIGTSFPFGFTLTSSSLPIVDSGVALGTVAPGDTRTFLVSGTLTGQENEERVFRFSIGTASSTTGGAPTLTYLTSEAPVTIVSPFISTTLAINGDTSPSIVVTPGAVQTVSLSYTNTLSTPISNASISVALSGSAIDYDSIETTNGFYRSTDHTLVFSRDTNSSLALLAPNASGVGTFTFSTLPATSIGGSPNITFSVSVSGTRRNEANILEQVSASLTKVAKVSTAASVAAATLHSSGALPVSGPVPPRVGSTTLYTLRFSVRAQGSPLAGTTLTATLPQYVSYTGVTGGSGSFSYNQGAHTITWTVGDLSPGASVEGSFQVSITPSLSQRGSSPVLAQAITITGFDRFAGISVTQSLDPLTIEMPTEPGYVPTDGSVQ